MERIKDVRHEIRCKQPKSVHSAGSCPARLLHLDTFSLVYTKLSVAHFYLFLNTESAKGVTESHNAVAVSVLQG